MGSEYCAVSSSPATRACTRCHTICAARGLQAELPQIVVGDLVHWHHPPQQLVEPDDVLDVGRDHGLGRARSDHARQLHRLLLEPSPILLPLDEPVDPEYLPAAQGDRRREGRQRFQLERGETPGPHRLLHPGLHRHHLEVEVQRPENGRPRGELADELERLGGVRADEGLPRARVRDANAKVEGFRNSAERHLAGRAHRGSAEQYPVPTAGSPRQAGRDRPRPGKLLEAVAGQWLARTERRPADRPSRALGSVGALGPRKLPGAVAETGMG